MQEDENGKEGQDFQAPSDKDSDHQDERVLEIEDGTDLEFIVRQARKKIEEKNLGLLTQDQLIDLINGGIEKKAIETMLSSAKLNDFTELTKIGLITLLRRAVDEDKTTLSIDFDSLPSMNEEALVLLLEEAVPERTKYLLKPARLSSLEGFTKEVLINLYKKEKEIEQLRLWIEKNKVGENESSLWYTVSQYMAHRSMAYSVGAEIGKAAVVLTNPEAKLKDFSYKLDINARKAGSEDGFGDFDEVTDQLGMEYAIERRRRDKEKKKKDEASQNN